MGNLLEDIGAWQAGTMTHDEGVELFQRLVDTGVAWRLNGTFGREAMRLIRAGLIQRNADKPIPATYSGAV